MTDNPSPAEALSPERQAEEDAIHAAVMEETGNMKNWRPRVWVLSGRAPFQTPYDRRPFRRRIFGRSYWVVRLAGTARIVNPHKRHGNSIYFELDYGRAPEMKTCARAALPEKKEGPDND